MVKSEKKKKRFISTPTYSGGKAAFGKFIKANLKYPEKAYNMLLSVLFLSFFFNPFYILFQCYNQSLIIICFINF